MDFGLEASIWAQGWCLGVWITRPGTQVMELKTTDIFTLHCRHCLLVGLEGQIKGLISLIWGLRGFDKGVGGLVCGLSDLSWGVRGLNLFRRPDYVSEGLDIKSEGV